MYSNLCRLRRTEKSESASSTKPSSASPKPSASNTEKPNATSENKPVASSNGAPKPRPFSSIINGSISKSAPVQEQKGADSTLVNGHAQEATVTTPDESTTTSSAPKKLSELKNSAVRSFDSVAKPPTKQEEKAETKTPATNGLSQDTPTAAEKPEEPTTATSTAQEKPSAAAAPKPPASPTSGEIKALHPPSSSHQVRSKDAAASANGKPRDSTATDRPQTAQSEAPTTVGNKSVLGGERKGGIWGSIRRHVSLRK